MESDPNLRQNSRANFKRMCAYKPPSKRSALPADTNSAIVEKSDFAVLIKELELLLATKITDLLLSTSLVVLTKLSQLLVNLNRIQFSKHLIWSQVNNT